MAINIHVVRVEFTAVNKSGQRVSKGDPATTINDVLQTSHQHLVIPDSTIPSSAGYPTVPAYLILEAAAGYKLQYMDQNMIVTYG